MNRIARFVGSGLTVAMIALGSSALAASKVKGGKDIVDVAAGAKGFTTLVKAVKAAGLVETLKGKGPFTVFAPTDEAFANLEKASPGTIATLLKPENKAKLTAVLTYHVVSGAVTSKQAAKLKDGTKVKTVNGKSVTVNVSNGVTIDGAKVIKADIKASNGVIHVIDKVLVPAE